MRLIGLGVLIIVLVPVLVIIDSYRIVRDVRPLAREAPDRTAIMQARLADRRTPRPLRHRYVRLAAISPHLIHSVIVHEDATFFEHHGFDEFEIRAALRRSLEERQLGRGASTITTQLARTLYLGTQRSILRKLREIPLTVRLEGALSKQRILELYLNLAEWGPGVFGAQAASLHHFGISARDLDPTQAALLAAALPSPRRSTPARPSAYLRRRARIILTRMEARGWLPPGEAHAYRQELTTGVPAAVGAEIDDEMGPEPEGEVETEEELDHEFELDKATEPESAGGAHADSVLGPPDVGHPSEVDTTADAHLDDGAGVDVEPPPAPTPAPTPEPTDEPGAPPDPP